MSDSNLRSGVLDNTMAAIVVDNQRAGVVVQTADGTVVDYNPAALKVLAIGVLPDHETPAEAEIRLKPGQHLIVYSDGLQDSVLPRLTAIRRSRRDEMSDTDGLRTGFPVSPLHTLKG